jgi:aminotransferase
MDKTAFMVNIVGMRVDTLRLSQLSENVMQSEIRAMSVECDRVGGVNLAQGVCDTPIPEPVLESAIQAIRDGYNIYTRADGIAPLREAIAKKMERYNHLRVDPEKQVIVTSGATGAFYSAAIALLDPGDEMLLFEPFYGYHVDTLLGLRVKPVTIPLDEPGWQIDFDRLRAAITPRTRAILINSPSNPCGKVFSRQELERLAAIAIEHDLFVFTDEIYEYFLYDGVEHISPATLPGMAERTITISGFSKTFSITGWRLGYLTADSKWTSAIAFFHDLTYVCAPSPFQHGATAGLLQLPDSFYAAMSVEYQQKRDQMCAALIDAGLTPSIPQGAYYVLANSDKLEGKTARQRARTLLARTGVAAVAGSAFMENGRGENLLRFCFAKKKPDLDRACNALKTLVD